MRLAVDERARVPFAVVGALIIMLSAFSAAYLQGIQSQGASHRLVEAELGRQRSVLGQVENTIAAEGHHIASKAVAASTQFLCNQSMLETVFQENYSAYLQDRFPYYEDPYHVEVEGFRASIYLGQQEVHDLLSSGEGNETTITVSDDSGTEATEAVEVLDTVTGHEYNETSVLASYIIAGTGNCTIKNMRSGAVMEAPVSFERTIDSPFPLMNSKMEALGAQSDNNAMSLARIVKYVLTTIAQFRVLEGYGSGLDSSPGNTTQVISSQDIELAVDLAIILETARLFRDYDETAVNDPLLGALLEDYLANGTLDPADIAAIYTGMDQCQLPVDMMLAQAINAIADQFLLKYLDYLGITDIVNAVYTTGQKLSQWVEDMGRGLSDFIFGDDGENREGARQVSDWIAHVCQDMPWPPEEIGMPGVLSGADGGSTDLAVVDILQPVDGIFDYEAVCTRLVSDTEGPILDTDGQVIGTEHELVLDNFNATAVTRPSSAAGQEGYLADFQPVDIVRQDTGAQNLWAGFYEDFYAEQEDVIYSSVRDAVKNMTLEMASIISMFIGQSDMSLEGYADGLHAVDPRDRTSALRSIGLVVDDVLQDTMEHLQSNPGSMGTILLAMTNEQAQLIIHLMEFVHQNYDALVGDACPVSGFGSLAMSTLTNSTVAVEYNETVTASYCDYNELGNSRGYVDEEPVTYHTTQYPDVLAVSNAVFQQNTNSLRADMEIYLDQAYETMKLAEAGYDYFGSPDNGLFQIALEQVVQSQRDDSLLRFIGQEPDSLISMGGQMVAGVLENIIWSGEIANTQYCPRMAYTLPFDLQTGQNVRYESFTIEHSLVGLDVSVSEPSGVHYTDAATFNARPFETSWLVSISGSVNVSCTSRSLPYVGEAGYEPAVVEKDIILDLGIPVMVYSGWDLVGVEYVSSASLANDMGKVLDLIKDFFGWVWDTIAAPINWLIDQIMKVVEFFQDIIGTLLGYASEIMNIITDIIGYLVELAQDLLRDIAAWVFDGIVGWILDHMPADISFSFGLFGFDFDVAFAARSGLDSASEGRGASLMSIGTRGNLLGAGFDLGVEFFMLSDDVAEMAGIDYNLIMDSQVRIKGFTLDTIVDPFMVTQPHLVECSGTGEGWGLDLVMPEIECYDSVQYSLHDIPGVGAALSNIPIPPLGVKASVNAGLEIVYTLRGIEEDNVVINEVELNPRGDGGQWVELYNPTDGPVDLGMWNLTTDGAHLVFPQGAVIESGGYHIAEFTGTALPVSGVRLDLYDASGILTDSTIQLSENSLLGSSETWQRSPNGANFSLAGEWVLAQETRGRENAAADIDFKQIAWNLIKGAFNTTWQSLKDQLELSLDFIVRLVTQFIQRFIEDVLRVIERSVVETSLFIDVMLTDMTGSGGAGITLSFVIEGGETLVQILRWIIDSVAVFLANFGSPSQPGQYPKLAEEVPEHLFLRLDFYGMVGVPQMVKSAVGEEKEMDPVKLAGRIEANIPALAALTGRDMGRWRINFGVYIEEMPAEIADPLFGTGEARPDVWLFKGCVFEK